MVFGLQMAEAATVDARPNLHSKLAAQSNTRKITRACVPFLVARIGHGWDAAAMQPLVAPIVQTMVVVNEIAGITSYDEYDELRENRPGAERTLLQGFQETNNRGAKAFRDRTRELILPFFLKGDGTMEQDDKYVHAMLSTFGFTGSTVLHHLHPAGHPVLRDCMATPRPTERGEPTPPSRPRPGPVRAPVPSARGPRPRPRHGRAPVTSAPPAARGPRPRLRHVRPPSRPDAALTVPRNSWRRPPPSTPSLTAHGVVF